MNNYPCNNVKVPISGWVDLHPFKAWCLQILPTIFDESMSYYECLCKLLDIMSATIDDVNLLGQEFIKLKDYVDNYFTNLDVQTEINNKLDEMATDGSLSNALSSYMYPTQYGFKTIIVGGAFVANSKNDYNKNLLYSITSKIGCNPIIDLCNNGQSLMTNYEDIIKSNVNGSNGVKYCFIMLEDVDYEYSRGAIEQKIYSIVSYLERQRCKLYIIPKPIKRGLTNKIFSNYFKLYNGLSFTLNSTLNIPPLFYPLEWNGNLLVPKSVAQYAYFADSIISQKPYQAPLFIITFTSEGGTIQLNCVNINDSGIECVFKVDTYSNTLLYTPDDYYGDFAITLVNANGKIGVLFNEDNNIKGIFPEQGLYKGSGFIPYRFTL